MSKKLLFLWCISMMVFSCKSDNDSIDCSVVNCVAPEDTLYLRFLNPGNDDDLLANGTIDTDVIEVFNEKGGTVSFTIQEFSGSNTFMAIPVSTDSCGEKSFAISLIDDTSFTINFETSYSDDSECCGPYTIMESFTTNVYSHDLVEPSILPAFVSIYIPSSD